MPNHHHHAKPRVRIKTNDTHDGLVIERKIHDGAIVVSATLTVEIGGESISAAIADEIEAAAREINARGGIVGHIKAACAVTSTDMVSVTDGAASIKTAPIRAARITLAAIVFQIDPEEAESVIRETMKRLQAIMSQNKLYNFT